MVYTKPELYVENFIPSVAVASCTRDFSGETGIKLDAQEVTCVRMGQTKDYIFASGTPGCTYQPQSMGWVATGNYSESDFISAINNKAIDEDGEPNAGIVSKDTTTSGSGGPGSPNNNRSYTVSLAGYFLTWLENNGSDHFGMLTLETFKKMINSY